MSKMKSDLSGFERYTSNDWDGEGAQAVSMETLKVARDLISAICHEADLPDASPSVAGALGLVWNIDNNYLYISIRNEKTAKFYRRGPRGLSEDQLIEAYSSDDLVKELTERLLSVRATSAIDKPQVDMTRTYITVELPYIKRPEVVIPDGPDIWATAPTLEAVKYKYKVA